MSDGWGRLTPMTTRPTWHPVKLLDDGRIRYECSSVPSAPPGYAPAPTYAGNDVAEWSWAEARHRRACGAHVLGWDGRPI